MHYKLAILLNGVAQIEYDRAVPLEQKCTDYQDSMDQKIHKWKHQRSILNASQ